MLSLDLFNSRYERELREGAVDDTIARLIDPLSKRAAEIKTQIRNGKLSGQEIDKLEREYEDLVQKRLDIILDRGPKTEQQQPVAKPRTGPGIGDIQDPKTKMAQLQQKAKKGPLANVGAGLKGFLTGKEEPLDEQELGRKGIGVRNMKALQATIEKGLARTEFQFAGGQRVFADEDDSDKLADYYNGMDSAGRSNFVYNIISDPVKFVALCKQLGVSLTPVAAQQPDLPGIPGQGELPLAEKRDQKKKFKSAIAQRELEKAMAAEPTAGDPIEAFILKSIENDQAQSQQIKDLESKIQTLRPTTAPVTSTATIAPATTARAAPTMPAPTEKPAPAVAVPQATQPEPAPSAEPAPVPDVKQLPKKDQKILSRVRRIEKRLRDRVDQYQTAKALQDTTPGQLQGMQQKIDDLQAQIQTQRDQLGKTAKLQLGQDDVWDVEASIVRPAFGQMKAAAEGQIAEHGGGIGPRQHWQSMMREGQPQDAIQRYLAIDAETDVEAVKKAIQAIHRDPALSANSKARLLSYIFALVRKHKLHIGRAYYQFLQQYMEEGNAVKETFGMPGTTIPRKSIIQGYTVFFNPDTQTVSVTRGGDSEEAAIEQARIGTVNLKTFRNAAEKLIDRIEDQLINEGIRDTASATAVIACLLAGGSLSGCATAPQQTTAQTVKTAQDVGRVVYNAKKITRAGTEEEVRQELKNIARGMSGRPEELNHSNILRIWRRINTPKEVPNQAPQNEAVAKEPRTKQELLDIIDKIQRMSAQERNPANLQIMRKDIELLKQKYSHLKEDTAALAAEDAILKRIFVKHRDLMMEYGPDKITQAAEEVAYNVGDIAHITDEQIQEWVGQVEYILGARP